MSIFKPTCKIAFDIDGIALNTGVFMWDAITKHLKLNWPIDRWVDYDVGNVLGVRTISLRPVYEPVLNRTDLPMVDGAAQVFQWLHAQYPDEALLFITSRRKQFKQAAIKSIRAGIGPTIPFQVICTSEQHSEEHRTNKLSILQQHKIEFYMEDNPMHWKQYIEAGITIGTLAWPWTVRDYKEYDSTHNKLLMFSDWLEVLHYFKERGLSWKDRHRSKIKQFTK